MNAKPLVFVGETEPRCWACGECGSVRLSEEDARRCCRCHRCGIVPPPSAGKKCATCREEDRLRRAEADRVRFLGVLRKAVRLRPDEYVGPVCATEEGEDYHATVEDYLDTSDPEDAPFVFACTIEKPAVDTDDLLQSIGENQELPDGYDWTDEDGLREFLDTWFARQADVWFVDTSRVIVLDAERFDALVKETP